MPTIDIWPSNTSIACQAQCLPYVDAGDYTGALACAMACHRVVEPVIPPTCPTGYFLNSQNICQPVEVSAPAEEDDTLLYIGLAALAYWLLKDN
jgi:hypothetical protein